MDTTQLTLLALGIGAIIGGAVSLLVVASLRARERVLAETSLDVPDGVRDVIHAMDDAAVVVDTSSTVLAASGPAGPFGLTEGQVLRSDELRSLARRARAAETSGAKAGTATSTMRLRRGAPPAELRLVAARATVISPRLVLVVFRDITERERVEEMRRDFVANTSHELKTPVGAVSLLAEAIESAADDPAQVRIFASRIGAEAARLANLTSRIMNLSRLQASDELDNVREVSVDEIVASAVDAHAIQATSAGVEVIRGGDRGLYVRGDSQVLSEAVGNLVANAIAYSPSASSVGVGVKAEGDIVEIVVTDRGIGIAEEDQQRIFERFYRADQARSRRTGGTGLGLSIVKHAVQRHGGEVRLWSRPGRGSTFTIRLPLVAGPEEIAPRKKRARKKKLVPGAKASRPARTNGEPA
ncbi:sensor histidine kinase [Microbacterium rhizomatis]|uniref:Sensor-like histidine kinase SenX3 n=1 Tax=Microbacterium rhizomatis TaxID=1631477 RepID=A0A5J5J2G2_9MICO|nr:ATP-binding protein [Microbacterium rhizomatis]KAA9107540.1 two-component sensor histidine kinase [Microbacterium rhizomatis]